MIRAIFFATSLVVASAGAASAAEPIEGTWKRPNGTLIVYAPSGAGKYCGKVMSGEYKGKSIGCMAGAGNYYEGDVKKLDEGKTYSGNATVSGDSLKLAGCVLAGLICKSETLARQ